MEEETRKESDSLKDILLRMERKADEKPKEKKFRMPFRGKVSKSKLRKGYVTIVVIDDNKNVDFRKEQIIDGTIKLDENYHAISEKDIYIHKGKPLLFQARKKLNPFDPLDGKNETYGQKYIMARMEGDRIEAKRKIGLAGGLIFGFVVVGIIAYALISGGGG